MSQFNTKITEAIEALDAEIADVEEELKQLKATRSNLDSVLVEDEAEAPKKSQRSKAVSHIKVTDKPQRTSSGRDTGKRAQIVSLLEEGKLKTSEIADEVGASRNYVYTIRNEMGIGKSDSSQSQSRGTRGRRASRNSNGGNGLTKRQRIRNMLNDGMEVKDIAAEIGISPGYVYNVKRGS
jgi:DNA-binding CsgD family transcriptional regulator